MKLPSSPGLIRARVSSISIAGCILALVFGTFSCRRDIGPHLVQARDGLYLRAEPSQVAQSIELIPSRAQLNVIEYDSFFPRCTQGTCGYWAKVEFRGYQGFAFQGFMKPLEGYTQGETPGIVIVISLLALTLTLGGISWIKRNSLKRFITGKGNGLEGTHGLSVWDRMRNTGESLATTVNVHLEKRRTEHEGQHVDLASQERRKRLRELSIRYVQDTAIYSSFPLHGMSFSHILMAVFALCLGCYALLSVVTLMGLISDRQIDTGFWLLVLLQIPGAILPISIFIFTFIPKAGFNVVNLVRYYLFFRGIDLVIIFVLFKYPSLRRALGERLSERYEFVAFAINLLIAVGIFMLLALYYSRSKRVKIRYGQYLKFGEGGSIFGIFPNVVRVTEEEASQLVSMIPTQAGGSSPTASSEFIDRSGHENKND